MINKDLLVIFYLIGYFLSNIFMIYTRDYVPYFKNAPHNIAVDILFINILWVFIIPFYSIYIIYCYYFNNKLSNSEVSNSEISNSLI